MAVIQKIRERYAKFAGAVIGLSLVAFIVSEGVNGRFGNMFGSDTGVAKVGDETIEGRDYAQMTRDFTGLSELFRRGQHLSEQEQAKLRQDVLDQMIVEKITDGECDKLGIVVSDAEEKEAIYGAQPDQAISQFFSAITGRPYEPGMGKQLESELKKSDDPKLAELGVQWEALKRYVVRGRRSQKYNAMIAASVYTPKALVAHNNKLGEMMAGLRYIKLPLTLIPDAQAPVTDADLKAYMEKHKAQFQVDQTTRAIEYIAYDVVPNSEDTSHSLGELQKLRDQFASNPANADEVFVNRNSEDRWNPALVTKARYTSPMADTIFKAGAGAVVGPFFDNNTYKLVKVISRRDIPDSVKAQHILIATASQQNPQGPTDTVAHQRADSLFAAIKAGANFDSLAAKFSDDPGSKVKGGDVGFFEYGKMVPEFNDSAFRGKTGEMKLVHTQFGWHIIRINEQKGAQPALQLATITKSLNIGQKADQAQFAKANEFAGRNRDGKAFDAAVKKEGLAKKISPSLRPGDQVIEGLGASREVVRWAYGAKAGDVSDPIHLENRYVVAKLSAINEAGMRALDAQLKPQLEAVVRAEKKASMLADQYKGAQNLDAIAQKSGQQVQSADSVAGNGGFIPNLGYEPKVIGYAFCDKLQPGTLSPAIKGRDGVYFISLTHRNVVPKPSDPMAIKMQAQMQDAQMKNSVAQGVGDVLRRMTKVTYRAQNI